MTAVSSQIPSVLVLAGGISHERDVSLRSGTRVAEALRSTGAEVEIREPDAALLDALREKRPEVIWPVLHGASGEDGALRDILHLTEIPFVGSYGGAARLAWDKAVAKTVIARGGIQTPESITLPRETFRELDATTVVDYLVTNFALPFVVKPARGGSAQGISMVNEPEQLARALVEAYTYCDVAIIERRVVGTEVAVSIIDLGAGPIALPPVEIEPLSGVYSFEARYNAGETNFYCPTRLSGDREQAAIEAALGAHRELGLRHLSRVDLIVDDAGTAWFLEANVLPGLTETSLMPLSIEAAGYSLGETLLSLAQSAMRNY